jgi:hypothetical protein
MPFLLAAALKILLLADEPLLAGESAARLLSER